MQTLPRAPLGGSDLHVTPICLGTMTFGEQVGEADAHRIMSHAVERGVNFIDTAEMYAVPTRAETYGATETIIGRWFATNPGLRRQVVLASKAAGPSRGMPWVHGGSGDLHPAQIVAACDASLKRLQTDVIDLYQIHWPNRNLPSFGSIYFDPTKDRPQTSIHDQLQALAGLVQAGKVRAIGLSNETPWGLMEFIKVAEQHGLPRVVSVQNGYSLANRSVENGLDEAMYRSGVGLLAYSPLAFGLLTGKYNAVGFERLRPEIGRLTLFPQMKQLRWTRPLSLAAAREYATLARAHGLAPLQLALGFCYRSWRVASTIIGVTSVAQLDECLDAWNVQISPELLAAIDEIRWRVRDPAQ
jgi:aryl-alcohol dehydrogenase-like predicted oxidoreductase